MTTDTDATKAALATQRIETPSWAYGNSGTRFKVFGQPGVPRNAFEKIQDAAQVHRHTGIAPSVALHIPWDKVDDYGQLAKHAQDNGIQLGTINANVFQDDDYKLGSVCNPDPRVRRKALDHLLECVDIMDVTGSRDLKVRPSAAPIGSTGARHAASSARCISSWPASPSPASERPAPTMK